MPEQGYTQPIWSRYVKPRWALLLAVAALILTAAGVGLAPCASADAQGRVKNISLIDATSSVLSPILTGHPPVTTTRVTPANPFVTRSGSHLMLGGVPFRFAGANEYYLGLDDNVRDSFGNPTYPTRSRIDDALQSAVATGASVVRSHTLGVSVGCSVCLEPVLGIFNDNALASADYTIYRAGQLGLKLMIPLTDQWRYYHGGESVFTGWAGYPGSPDLSVNSANSLIERTAESHFYNNTSVIRSFQIYVGHVLNHVNPYNHLAYKNDPTVMAWETGNELWTAPPGWTEQVAAFIKRTLGARQLVADGSAADGMTVANAAIDAADIDIVGGHFYPVDVAWMQRDAAIAARHGKAYVVGEFDWTDAAATTALITAVQSDANISGDLYWTLLPHLENGEPEPHDDGFAMYSPATSVTAAPILARLKAHAVWMSNS